MKTPRGTSGPRPYGQSAPPIPFLAGALFLALATGCAANAASSTVSESDFARLTPAQTGPVDEARAELALARDELGRAKLGAVNDQHEGALARSDQATASADKSRAAAETKIGADSNEPAQMQRALDDTRSAALGKDVADARREYSKKLETSHAAQILAAERKIVLMTERVNLAKLRALEGAAVPASGRYDHATAMERVVDAQRDHDRASADAAKALGETAAAEERWKKLAQKQM